MNVFWICGFLVGKYTD